MHFALTHLPILRQPGVPDRPARPSNADCRSSRWMAGICCALVYLALQGCSSTPKSVASVAKPVGHTESGMASFYGNEFQSRKTSSGEIFDQAKKTAAHRTLAFGTRLKVTNTQNSKSVMVRVNDRGPFAKGRILDLSSSAFKTIANLNAGVIPVRIEVVN
jgi:rare lipoprotein A